MRAMMNALAMSSLVLVSAAAPGFAAEEPDSAAIQSTIQGQLEAFKRDDAGAAYGFAAPSIQRMFPTQDIFLQMVRQGYLPVYRPQAYRFDRLREVGGSLAQEVRITDSEGTQWLALYTMEKQPDGSWKISGCTLVKAPDQSV
jgi:hypothetical protein